MSQIDRIIERPSMVYMLTGEESRALADELRAIKADRDAWKAKAETKSSPRPAPSYKGVTYRDGKWWTTETQYYTNAFELMACNLNTFTDADHAALLKLRDAAAAVPTLASVVDDWMLHTTSYVKGEDRELLTLMLERAFPHLDAPAVRAPERVSKADELPRPAFVSDSFASELCSLLNKHSQDNATNTPDFVLAEFMLGVLRAFDLAMQQRDGWESPREAYPPVDNCAERLAKLNAEWQRTYDHDVAKLKEPRPLTVAECVERLVALGAKRVSPANVYAPREALADGYGVDALILPTEAAHG